MATEKCVICGHYFNTESEYACELGMGDWVCSPACWEAAMHDSLQIECEHCGRTFDVRTGYDKWGNKCKDYEDPNVIYCSRKCYEEANGYSNTSAKAAPVPTSQPAYPVIPQTPVNTYRCDYCGKDFNEGVVFDKESALTFCCIGHKAAFKRECPDEYEEACRKASADKEERLTVIQNTSVEDNEDASIEDLLELESRTHDPKVQYLLSSKFRDEKKDYDACFSWAEKSAAQNFADGKARLAWCYLHGKGCQKDMEKGFLLARQAAETGNPSACVVLGSCYENGTGVEQNKNSAFNYYKKAADQNYKSGFFNVASCYEKGFGTEKDLPKALSYYEKAADKGIELAKKEKERLEENKKKCASMYAFFSEETTIEKLLEAENWFHNPIVQAALSQKYYDEKNDSKTSFMWAEKSAAQNCIEGMALLGSKYIYGIGCEENADKGLQLVRKVVEMIEADDTIPAQNNSRGIAFCALGSCYKLGKGIEKNEKEAVSWYQKAAEREYAMAQFYLGQCYDNGIGVNKDYKKAREWYVKAAKQGHYMAKKRADELYDICHACKLRKGKPSKVSFNCTYTLDHVGMNYEHTGIPEFQIKNITNKSDWGTGELKAELWLSKEKYTGGYSVDGFKLAESNPLVHEGINAGESISFMGSAKHASNDKTVDLIPKTLFYKTYTPVVIVYEHNEDGAWYPAGWACFEEITIKA